ncbi:polysaccharide deacetylase family protein [Luedemannella helvata]|uniref:NodB homology domain-containing protein n=1 Tax=Luedemannella helvata TaxID=349315 RepID=A0ABP4X2S4_9ACTN
MRSCWRVGVTVAASAVLVAATAYSLGWLAGTTAGPEAPRGAPPASGSRPHVDGPARVRPAPPPVKRPRAPTTRRPGTADRHGPWGAWVSTGTRGVALTFDDGPDPRWTPDVLGLLRRYRVRATFCLVGREAARHPRLVRAIAAGGHTLCNHSWRHDLDLGRRSPAAIRADLVATTRAIERAAPGATVHYFRQPGGRWRERVVAAARGLGMTSLHWSVDARDWRRPGRRAIVGITLRHTGPGSIILLHDGGGVRAGTVAALRELLPSLTSRFALVAPATRAP